LDNHITHGHDWNRRGHLPDRHAHLEEMLQEIKFYGDTLLDSLSTSNDDAKSAPEAPRETSDQQPGHQIKSINITISNRNSPKKGRYIGTIFKATSMMNLITTRSAKTFLLQII